MSEFETLKAKFYEAQAVYQNEVRNNGYGPKATELYNVKDAIFYQIVALTRTKADELRATKKAGKNGK